MKKQILTALSLAGVILLTSCGGENKEEATSTGNDIKTEENTGDLVMYSPNSEGLINSLIPAFEEKTGIKVDLQQAGTGELFTKLRGESKDPVADVMFGGGYTTYTENEDLFEEYVAQGDEKLPEAYQNKSKIRTSYTLDGSCLIINKDLTKGMEINGYKDLLNPELKGKIATADPTSSSSAFAHLTNMLKAMGGYESDDAWNYVKDLFTNVDGKIQSSSSSVYKTVADGEMAVGLSYEDPVLQLKKDGADNIEIVYMEEGSVYLPAGAGIIKGAKNKENAQKFMDFLVSQEAQDILGTQTTNRPVLENAKVSDDITPITDIKTIEEDYDYVIKNTEKIQNKYKEIFADIQG